MWILAANCSELLHNYLLLNVEAASGWGFGVDLKREVDLSNATWSKAKCQETAQAAHTMMANSNTHTRAHVVRAKEAAEQNHLNLA